MESATSLRGKFVRGAAGSLAVRAGRMLLSLALAILLARKLGPEGYGTYTYAFAIASLLAVPVHVGLPTVVVRETAKALAMEQWQLMRGLWRWATATGGLVSAGITLAGTLTVCLLGHRVSQPLAGALMWGFLLVPAIALANVPGAALRGLGRVVLGQVPETILQPGLFIGLVLVASAMTDSARLAAADAMALQVSGAVLTLLAGTWLLRTRQPGALSTTSGRAYQTRAWGAAALPLALVSGMGLVNQYTDVLTLALFSDSQQVGIYRVAVSGAALVGFGLGAMTSMAAPYFARLHSSHDRAQMQRVVTATSRAILGLTAPVVLMFVLAGKPLIALLFGPEYGGAHLALAILATGQLASALFGPVGVLLMMTGHERETFRGMAVGAAVNVLLNLLLVPLLGLSGAAAATASSTVVWNWLLWRSARRQLQIETIAVTRGPH